MKKASLKIAIMTIALVSIIAIVVSQIPLNNRQTSNPKSEIEVGDSNAIDGLFVVPELPFGTLMAIVASLGALAGLATKRLKLKH